MESDNCTPFNLTILFLANAAFILSFVSCGMGGFFIPLRDKLNDFFCSSVHFLPIPAALNFFLVSSLQGGLLFAASLAFFLVSSVILAITPFLIFATLSGECFLPKLGELSPRNPKEPSPPNVILQSVPPSFFLPYNDINSISFNSACSLVSP